MKRARSALVDDLDGSPAAGTIRFGLDGRTYEIDLSEENAARLRAIFADYVATARVRKGSVRAARSGSSRRRGTRTDGTARTERSARSARSARGGTRPAARSGGSRRTAAADPTSPGSPDGAGVNGTRVDGAGLDGAGLDGAGAEGARGDAAGSPAAELSVRSVCVLLLAKALDGLSSRLAARPRRRAGGSG